MRKKQAYQWVDNFFALPMANKKKKIVERLKKSSEMKHVYDEINKRINEKEFPQGRYEVLSSIIDSAVIYEKKKVLKDGLHGQKDIMETQKKISTATKKLRVLLNQLVKIQEESCFTSGAKIDPLELVCKAGMNMRPSTRRIPFKHHIRSKKILLNDFFPAPITGNRPILQEVLDELINEMKESVMPRNQSIKKLLSSRKSSPADFIRVFASGLSTAVFLGNLPNNFNMTAWAIAIITGCALDIDGGVTEGSVIKTFKRM